MKKWGWAEWLEFQNCQFLVRFTLLNSCDELQWAISDALLRQSVKFFQVVVCASSCWFLSEVLGKILQTTLISTAFWKKSMPLWLQFSYSRNSFIRSSWDAEICFYFNASRVSKICRDWQWRHRMWAWNPMTSLENYSSGRQRSDQPKIVTSMLPSDCSIFLPVLTKFLHCCVAFGNMVICNKLVLFWKIKCHD